MGDVHSLEAAERPGEMRLVGVGGAFDFSNEVLPPDHWKKVLERRELGNSESQTVSAASSSSGLSRTWSGEQDVHSLEGPQPACIPATDGDDKTLLSEPCNVVSCGPAFGKIDELFVSFGEEGCVQAQMSCLDDRSLQEVHAVLLE